MAVRCGIDVKLIPLRSHNARARRARTPSRFWIAVNPSMEAAGKTSLFCTLRNAAWGSGAVRKALGHLGGAGSPRKYSDDFPVPNSSPGDADRRRRAASWCASTEVAAPATVCPTGLLLGHCHPTVSGQPKSRHSVRRHQSIACLDALLLAFECLPLNQFVLRRI